MPDMNRFTARLRSMNSCPPADRRTAVMIAVFAAVIAGSTAAHPHASPDPAPRPQVGVSAPAQPGS
jgi:hypothetical protein